MANATVELLSNKSGPGRGDAVQPSHAPHGAPREVAFDPAVDIIFGSILILFSVVATIGNITVIFVFFKESILRTTTNYFLMSLAFSDLLVGLLVMPFGIIERFNYGHWLFGRDLCDIWHAVDVMSCTASIMNLCCIAIERYQAIHDPIKYPLRPNKTRVYIGILIAWFCSAIISFPAIAWWRAVDAHKLSNNGSVHEMLPGGVCEFTSDSVYLISSSMVSFYVPTACMLVLYYKIYRTAITVSRSFATGERSVALAQRGGTYDSVSNAGASLVLRVHRGKTIRNRPQAPTAGPGVGAGVGAQSCTYKHAPRPTHPEHRTPPALPEPEPPSHGRNGSQAVFTHQASVSSQDSDINVISSCNKMLKTSMPTIQSMAVNTIVEMAGRTGAPSTRLHVLRKLHGFMTLKQQFKRFAREQKAAKTLGLIIFLFIACWGPFFLCSLLIALQQLEVIGVLLPDDTLPMLIMCVTWLGYANSCINCFAYPCAMREFRRAIYKHVAIPLRKCLRHTQTQLLPRGAFVALQRSTAAAGAGRSTASSVRCKSRAPAAAPASSEAPAASDELGRNGLAKLEPVQASETVQTPTPTPTQLQFGLANTVHCTAAITTKLALPYAHADVPHKLLAEVMSMNGSLV